MKEIPVWSTLKTMLRKGRKLVEIDISLDNDRIKLGEIAAPAKHSVVDAFNEIEDAMLPLTSEARTRVIKRVNKQVKAITDSQLSKFKDIAGIDPQAKSEIVDIMERLSPTQRYSELVKYRATQDQALERTQEQVKALDNCHAWLGRLNDCEKFSLERNDVSRLHKYIEAGHAGRILDISKKPNDKSVEKFLIPPQTFVVKHDWANAFESASGIEDEIKLPYEYCGFEFRVSGNTVLIHAFEVPVSEEYEDGVCLNAAVECLDHWMLLSEDKGEQDYILGFLWQQIRAICIALDADVATEEVVRAPAALNAKRTKAGKIPLRDYHVVDLSRRHRVSNPLAGEPGKKHRMHFVRGHWRHYEEHKTWIKWHLRGDPHLGFIQKHYAL